MLPPGVVDTHIHTSPDVMPRRWTDLELAQHARDAGYRGFVLKNHHSLTATRAALVNEAVPGVSAFGGLAVNPHAFGGLDRRRQGQPLGVLLAFANVFAYSYFVLSKRSRGVVDLLPFLGGTLFVAACTINAAAALSQVEDVAAVVEPDYTGL